MDKKKIDAIRERCEKATSGPWSNVEGWAVIQGEHTGEPVASDKVLATTRDGLAEFIAHTRTDIPLLLAEIDRLTAIVNAYALSARTIDLYLKPYCDGSLSYAEMIADASRKASAVIGSLQAERDAAVEELNNAQPCFACKGFERNGGKCLGAGTCRIRDIARHEGFKYTDSANGESWQWRGLEGR